MGLDTSHDCWHGSYSTFGAWRKELARAAGLPPLNLMKGFCDEGQPIEWDILKPSSLITLLNHSDCDGEIQAIDCAPLADTLSELLPKLPQDWRSDTQQFIDGLRLAASKQENVDFH